MRPSFGGDVTSPPLAVRNHDGRLELFAIGSNGALYHRWETSPGGGWSGWHSLGGDSTSFFPSNDADGSIVVFARGIKGPLYRIDQKSPDGSWGSWVSMSSHMKGTPAADRNHDGRLEVFYRSTSDAVDHHWEGGVNTW